MMGFHVGQNIVCVDDAPGRVSGVSALVRGRIYTIRGINTKSENEIGFLLVGVPRRRPDHRDGSERGWVSTRFRPLDESRLSIFREMLVTPPTKELVADHLDASIADCERAVREALGF